MTDNMIEFLEAVSQDKAFLEKLAKAETHQAVISLAAEKGFALTTEDLKKEESSDELSDDELDAVAGGKSCLCIAGGGGEADRNSAQHTCACIAAGAGESSWDDCHEHKGPVRCYCAVLGVGDAGTVTFG